MFIEVRCFKIMGYLRITTQSCRATTIKIVLLVSLHVARHNLIVRVNRPFRGEQLPFEATLPNCFDHRNAYFRTLESTNLDSHGLELNYTKAF
jgi:hypothetical protein